MIIKQTIASHRVGHVDRSAAITIVAGVVLLDGNEILRKWITLKGIHNYHPRHLIQALDFVVANRDRFPFKDIVDSTFKLDDLNEAFKKEIGRAHV